MRGERHPQTLVTRSLRASVLRDLGRYSDALAEIEAYAPVLTEVRGERHPETLGTRRLHADCSANLERWDEALGELELIMPAAEEIYGTGYWWAVYRSSRAGIEIAAKHSIDRSAKLVEIITKLATATSPADTNTLLSRYRLARCYFQRGEIDKARTEITDTIAHFDPQTAPGHRVLRAAKALLDMIDGRPTAEKLIV